MRARDAIDHHAVLAQELNNSEWLHTAALGVALRQRDMVTVEGRPWTTTIQRDSMEFTVSAVRQAILLGETAFVSKDMTKFARIAAAELTEDDTFGDPRNLPLENGVLFLEETVEYHDIRGVIYPVDGFLWGTFYSNKYKEKAVSLFTLTNNRKHPLPVETPEGKSTTMPASIAHSLYHVLAGMVIFKTTKVGHSLHMSVDQQEKYLKNSVVSRDEDSIRAILESQNYGELVMENPTSLWVAIMRLMCQELIELSDEKASRPQRRRAERLNLKPAVTVVSLRRKKYLGKPGQETGSGRHLHYRHLVRGHWKSQPHDPSCNGCKCRYISHYFRGPEDAPLYVSDKVNALIR